MTSGATGRKGDTEQLSENKTGIIVIQFVTLDGVTEDPDGR